MTHHILIIDDDTELCELLSEYLSHENLHITLIHDGLEAINHLQTQHQDNKAYDAIVLDFMLPGLQGLDILQRLRQFSSTPVLMLTARGDDIDRIVGLESGADDYLPKPCNPRELLARLRAILRRTETSPIVQSSKTVFEIHGIRLDSGNRHVSIDGETISLTSAEFNTLHALIGQRTTLCCSPISVPRHLPCLRDESACQHLVPLPLHKHQGSHTGGGLMALHRARGVRARANVGVGVAVVALV